MSAITQRVSRLLSLEKARYLPAYVRKEQVLEALEALTEARGFPPTVRDIAVATGMSPAWASKALTALEEDGNLVRDSHCRGYRIVRKRVNRNGRPLKK